MEFKIIEDNISHLKISIFGFFSSCGEQGLLSSFGVQASHWDAFSCCGAKLSSCGAWAQLPQGTWGLTKPGVEPMSSALASKFFTTKY